MTIDIPLNSNNVIHELRKKGYKVRVMHHRYNRSLRHLKPLSFFKAMKEEHPGQKLQAHPRGGMTIIEITDPNGRTFRGSAQCMKTENFNKRRAIRICLGRIVKDIENEVFLTAAAPTLRALHPDSETGNQTEQITGETVKHPGELQEEPYPL